MTPAAEPTKSGASGPVPQGLLPMSSSIGPDGRLRVAGLDVIELAEEYGTPLFVYDEAELRERCREAVAVWGEGVAYATKAFLCVAMARLAFEEGMCLDVSTGGELHVALAAGVTGDRLVFHGNNKSEAELASALAVGVGRIVVDSFDEIDRLERLLLDPGSTGSAVAPPKVLARVTPGVEVHTHEFVRTGQDDSKFGFGLASGAAAQAIARLRQLDAEDTIDFVGVHTHIGSQVFAVDTFVQAIQVIADFFAPLGLPELVVGGGLGVAYVSGEEAPTMASWAGSVHRACREAGIPESVRVTAEPGRSIVATAGMTLYRVGTIKDVPGYRTYVSIDGGISDNPRPVLYGSGYEAFLPRSVDADRPRPIRLVGKHCESGDIIVSAGYVPADLAVDDILATPVTGAYGHSMASNYNKVPRAAVVFVADGESRLVVRRETFDDLLRYDV
jgi:diaminopimelate decarboxylase